MIDPYTTEIKRKNNPTPTGHFEPGTFVMCPLGFGEVEEIFYNQMNANMCYIIKLLGGSMAISPATEVFIAGRA